MKTFLLILYRSSTDVNLFSSLSCCVFVYQLYPSLCELAHVLSVDGPVKQRLDALAGELAKAADKELQVGWWRNRTRNRRQQPFPNASVC